MLAILRNLWTLFLGLAFLLAGNGLMFPLLGLRAVTEGFSPATIGMVMSGYALGFVLGTQFSWRAVERVGHIRTFGALAAIASAAALIHIILINPAVWFLTRMVYGFCFAGLYVVAESWLNAKATNETRGKTMAVYMFVQLGFFALGQSLVGLTDPDNFQSFILVSVLISVAVVPMLLTVINVPEFYVPERIGLRRLYRISSIGVVGCFVIGIVQGAFWNMGIVYAQQIGMKTAQVGAFMAVMTLGGMLMQLPIGWLSDRMGRPKLVMFLSAAAAVLSFLIALGGGAHLPSIFALIFVYGGVMLSIYGVCVALTNDYLDADQIVPASAALVMLFGLGSVIGPLLGAAAMELISPAGLFYLIGGLSGLYALFILYRLSRNIHVVGVEDSGTMAPMAGHMSPVAASVMQETWREDGAEADDGSDEGDDDAEPTSAVNAPDPDFKGKKGRKKRDDAFAAS